MGNRFGLAGVGKLGSLIVDSMGSEIHRALAE